MYNDVPDSITESSFDSDCESELVSELTDEKIIINIKIAPGRTFHNEERD